MSALHDALALIRERLTRYEGEAINEQNTKATLIAPLLRALGWDVEDLEEVHREYRHHPSDNPVDFALLDLRTPRLFVEAKALGRNLSDRKWANQIMGYASVAGVEWVVLTDGDEYRIYNAHASVPVEEKLFRTVRLTDDDPQINETLALLSKPGLQENNLEAHWQAQFVDRQVQTTLKGLFAPKPDRSLVNLMRRRISDLSRRDIEESLRRVRPRFDLPVEPVAATEMPRPAVREGKPARAAALTPLPECDTVVVPAREDGFNKVFLGERCWYAVRISEQMKSRIKYIAAYRTAPVSAITHVAPVRSVERWGDSTKSVLNFGEPAQEIPPIRLAKGGRVKAPQNLRYTTKAAVDSAKSLDDLW